MINEEKTQEASGELKQETENDTTPEAYTEQRTQVINNEINTYQGPKNPTEESDKINEIQQNYQQYIEEAGAEDNQETLQLFQNKMQDEIKYYENEAKKFSDMRRLKKATEILSPQDFQRFEQILGNHKGSTEQLFDTKDKVMHTTNDFTFKKMLNSGIIKTDNKKEGMYKSTGASFTDGNFEKAATFQTLFDDQNTRSEDKDFNTQNYNDKVFDFVEHFWDNKQEETKRYLSEISGGKKIESLDDAIEAAEGFKFQAKPKEIENDPKTLSKLFGVTIIYDKGKIPELTKEGTESIQQDFELRSYRNGGVPMSEASTIFVPESQIDNIQAELQNRGLDYIEIRPSEEIEAIRMVNILNER